jgi:hypothetical protein
MNTQRIRGVALIVENPEGQILVLQEYETKSHLGKCCGMFSIPAETSEPGEPDSSAIVRLVKEELPGFDSLIDGALLTRIGAYRIVPRVWVNLYSARVNSTRLPDSKGLAGKEVGNHQWISPAEALNLWLRQGAREMIGDFIANKKRVLCRHCCAPEKK